jgi:hypothetical protein
MKEVYPFMFDRKIIWFVLLLVVVLFGTVYVVGGETEVRPKNWTPP